MVSREFLNTADALAMRPAIDERAGTEVVRLEQQQVGITIGMT
jgi:hypothetical protein